MDDVVNHNSHVHPFICANLHQCFNAVSHRGKHQQRLYQTENQSAQIPASGHSADVQTKSQKQGMHNRMVVGKLRSLERILGNLGGRVSHKDAGIGNDHIRNVDNQQGNKYRPERVSDH